ncbi:hypothetical protein C8J56DRAFT_424823 [Mycena floridula]|nr:hypothetical protein C8J56DRAFT_424823 [Mycena floridula]
MSFRRFQGLAYYRNHQVFSLPLVDVHATVSINDLAAQVKLVHGFTNDAIISVDGIYSFPVPARAAVSGFTLIKEDGTRVLGIVQEKGKLRRHTMRRFREPNSRH